MCLRHKLLGQWNFLAHPCVTRCSSIINNYNRIGVTFTRKQMCIRLCNPNDICHLQYRKKLCEATTSESNYRPVSPLDFVCQCQNHHHVCFITTKVTPAINPIYHSVILQVLTSGMLSNQWLALFSVLDGKNKEAVKCSRL